MGNVQSNIEYIVSVIDDASGNFKKIAQQSVIMGAAITAALGVSVKQFVETGDALQKMSIRTGFSTEALSQLRYGARLSDTSLESLEMGILGMSKFIENANDGLTTSADALGKMSLKLSDVQGLSPEQTFFKLASAVADIPDPMQRLALATEIFGRNGKELLPLLAGGSEGFQRMRDEAERLGIVMDESASQGAAQLADAYTRVIAGGEGISNTIAQSLLPTLATLAEQVQPVLEKINAWMEANPELTRTIVLVTGAVGVLLVVFGTVTLAVGALSAALAALGVTLALGGAVVLAIGGLITLLIVLAQHWEGLKWMIGNFISTTLEYVKAWARDVVSIFELAWLGVETAFTAGKDFVMSVWNAFLEGLKATIMAPIDAIRGAFDDLFTWIGDTISSVLDRVSGVANSVRSFFSTSTAPRRRATGGVINEPFTMVGEQGPEIIAAPSGSRVYTASQTRQMLGGVSLSVTVNGSIIGLSPRQLVEELGREVMRNLQPLISHA